LRICFGIFAQSPANSFADKKILMRDKLTNEPEQYICIGFSFIPQLKKNRTSLQSDVSGFHPLTDDRTNHSGNTAKKSTSNIRYYHIHSTPPGFTGNHPLNGFEEIMICF